MQVDWIWGFVGGLMIGSAAALYLLGKGRIMGVSGILGGLLDRSSGAQTWERLIFVFGVITTPAIIVILTGAEADTKATSNPLLLIGAGLLVGIGTRLGNGCTSGHGVCGISRLSLRSIVATCTFILTGVVTVLVLRQVGGL